jgi:enoyl-CoA hydratase/carnithine racemase
MEAHMTGDGQIIQAVDGHVLLIGISRPDKRNSLTPSMMNELAGAFDRLQSEPELRVGVL